MRELLLPVMFGFVLFAYVVLSVMVLRVNNLLRGIKEEVEQGDLRQLRNTVLELKQLEVILMQRVTKVNDELTGFDRTLLELRDMIETFNSLKTILLRESENELSLLGGDWTSISNTLREFKLLVSDCDKTIRDVRDTAAMINSARDALMGLSDQIATGDAVLLQRVMLAYKEKVPVSKKYEQFHRYAKGVITCLGDFICDEKVQQLYEMQKSGSRT